MFFSCCFILILRIFVAGKAKLVCVALNMPSSSPFNGDVVVDLSTVRHNICVHERSSHPRSVVSLIRGEQRVSEEEERKGGKDPFLLLFC